MKENISSNNWLLNSGINEQVINQIIQEINSFPLSTYQEKGKSEIEEGKKYLKLQHGNNIIK